MLHRDYTEHNFFCNAPGEILLMCISKSNKSANGAWHVLCHVVFYRPICVSVGERYAQLVFRSGNSASLWSLKAIYSMCQMEQTQVNQRLYFPILKLLLNAVFGWLYLIESIQ